MNELKTISASFDLKRTGTKEEIISRLINHYLNNGIKAGTVHKLDPVSNAAPLDQNADAAPVENCPSDQNVQTSETSAVDQARTLEHGEPKAPSVKAGQVHQ